MRLYLDACCLNRPFDDQSQLRVHLESEAVLAILERVEQGRWILVSSVALEFELAKNPDAERRARTQRLLSIARECIPVGPPEKALAETIGSGSTLRGLDALHLACAQSLGADVFLTTDDALLRAAGRIPAGALTIKVANPLVVS